MSAPPKLPAKYLTAGLLAVVVGTLGILTVYFIRAGKAADQPLPIEISSGDFAVPVPGGQAAVLAEALKLKNLSDKPIPRLAVVVNREFYLYRESPLGAGEELVLPLEIFKTKANHPYRPDAMDVWKVTVYGQLPSRARGVAEFRVSKPAQEDAAGVKHAAGAQ